MMKNWQHLLTATATTMVLVISTGAFSTGAYAERGKRSEDCERGPMGHHRMMGGMMMGGMMGNPEHRLRKMALFLDMTEEQQAKLEAYTAPLKEGREAKRERREKLHKEFRQAIEEGVSEAQLQTLADQLGQMVAQGAITRVKTMQYFKSILTPEQLEKLEKMKAMHGHGKGHHG